MKKIWFKCLGIAIMPLLLGTCTGTSTSKLISVEDFTFARTGAGDQLEVVSDPAVFQRGEPVHLVLQNVGPFKKDSAGLNWFDMDMEITGPDETVILSQTAMLGDAGHLALDNNRAASPYATCYNTAELAPGKYKFTIRIYDRIGKGTAKQNAFFTIE
ncbi:MAG: hypothetical protein JXR52_07495 [Bacteroidales bacterium]|nr:hypothetical protein [Bacteroidales bacterium]